MRRRVIALSVVGAMAFVAACGDDDEGTGDASGATDTAAAPVKTIEVALTEFRLSPANPSLSKAGEVEFEVTNSGKVVHALEVEGPEGEVETEAIDPGKRATLKADLGKAGRYTWYCPIGDHESRGMKGQITVAGGGGDEKEDKEAGSDGHGGY